MMIKGEQGAMVSKDELLSLWKREGQIKPPVGLFGNRCPECHSRLNVTFYHVIVSDGKIWEYTYRYCACGYRHNSMRAYLDVLGVHQRHRSAIPLSSVPDYADVVK